MPISLSPIEKVELSDVSFLEIEHADILQVVPDVLEDAASKIMKQPWNATSEYARARTFFYQSST